MVTTSENGPVKRKKGRVETFGQCPEVLQENAKISHKIGCVKTTLAMTPGGCNVELLKKFISKKGSIKRSHRADWNTFCGAAKESASLI